MGLVDHPRSLERARERTGHAALDLLPVLPVDAGLNHAGIVQVVGHERLGVVRLPRLAHALEDAENLLLIRLSSNCLACHGFPRSVLGAATAPRLIDGQAQW